MVRRSLACACAWLLLACPASAPSDDVPRDTTSTTIAGSSGDADSSSSSTAAIEDGPPQILDIGKSTVSLTVGERVVLTAFVQHPRGDAAVTGGLLLGPEAAGTGMYGAFVRGENGRWSIDVGWNDVAAATDLTFTGETTIEFVARFVDDAGQEAELTAPMHFRCIPLAPFACDGVCTDVDGSTDHCGACDHPCETQEQFGVPFVGGCTGGTCGPLWSDCFDPALHVNCDEACTSLGSYCVEGGCGGYTVLPVGPQGCGDASFFPIPNDPDTCDATPLSPLIRCCCSAP